MFWNLAILLTILILLILLILYLIKPKEDVTLPPASERCSPQETDSIYPNFGPYYTDVVKQNNFLKDLSNPQLRLTEDMFRNWNQGVTDSDNMKKYVQGLKSCSNFCTDSATTTWDPLTSTCQCKQGYTNPRSSAGIRCDGTKADSKASKLLYEASLGYVDLTKPGIVPTPNMVVSSADPLIFYNGTKFSVLPPNAKIQEYTGKIISKYEYPLCVDTKFKDINLVDIESCKGTLIQKDCDRLGLQYVILFRKEADLKEGDQLVWKAGVNNEIDISATIKYKYNNSWYVIGDINTVQKTTRSIEEYCKTYPSFCQCFPSINNLAFFHPGKENSQIYKVIP